MYKVQFGVSTPTRDAMLNITNQVQTAVNRSGVLDGICIVYVPHTTAGVTINEGMDPDVVRDVLAALDRAVPWIAGYHHAEGNSAAHVKSIITGQSAHLLVENGKLQLGTWQQVFFCEFDGPRQRNVWVTVLKG